MELEIEIYFDKFQQSLLDIFDTAMKYGDEESQNQEIYLEAMMAVLESRDRRKYTLEALETCVNMEHENEVKEQYNKYLAEHVKPSNYKKCKEYKKFKEQLRMIVEKSGERREMDDSKAGNCEMVVEEEEINTLDPLTKVPMKSPLRNIHCTHHYERKSIMAILKAKKNIKCPVVGCGNKNVIDPKDLVDDIPFKRKLQEIYRRQADNENIRSS